MSRQKTIIHLLKDFKYNEYRYVYTSSITTDISDISYPKIVMGVYPNRMEAYIYRTYLRLKFAYIGIRNGGEVYIIIHNNGIYAYGSTTKEKWLLTSEWEIVDTSDERIQDKI